MSDRLNPSGIISICLILAFVYQTLISGITRFFSLDVGERRKRNIVYGYRRVAEYPANPVFTNARS